MRTSVRIAIAAAIAAGAVAGPSFAWAPTDTPAFKLYVAGGSAQGGAFLAFAQKLMANDGHLDVYTDDTTCAAQGANYRAVFGTWAATTGGIPAGSKVYIAYANNGGTFKNGINAIARATQVDYQVFLNNASNTGCAAAGTGVPSPFTAAANYHVSTAATTENQVPDVGFSDEEMALFTGDNLPTAAPNSPLTQADFNNTKRSQIYENVFGVAINSVLATQMQSTFGNVNLTTAQISAIYSGNYSDWSQICQLNGAGATVCLPAGGIALISRSPGSGSKAAWNEYFLNNPGTAGFKGNKVSPVDQLGSFGDCTNFSGNSVCAQSSNGNVKKALNTANTAGNRALGILGMEFQPTASDHFQFAALDGVTVAGVTSKTCGNTFANAFEPARVVNGEHKLFYTNSLNTRIVSLPGRLPNGTLISPTVNEPFLGDGTIHSDFINAFSTAASNPVVEVSVPGVLLDPDVVGPPSGQPYDACITSGTHHTDSTEPLQLQF